MGKKLDKAAQDLKNFEQGIDVSDDPRAVIPERALVFELNIPIENFEAVAIELGFEFLAGENRRGLDSEEGDDDFEGRTETERPQGPNLYLTMPSERGLTQLLSRWKRFVKGEPAPSGLSKLWVIFSYLTELRTWSAKDRIDPAMASYVQRMLNEKGDEPVAIEIDLWFRSTQAERDKALSTLRKVVDSTGGIELDLVTIEAIRYLGALISVPASVAAQLVEGTGGLAHLNEIMTIRPQSEFALDDAPDGKQAGIIPAAPLPTKPPIAAILDGYPVEEHEALAGRITVVELETKAIDVPVQSRIHGTAMASLVVRGDLHKEEAPSERRVAVIPVLTTDGSGRERIPKGKLPIGVIFRALQAIVGEGRTIPPSLQNVVIVNHSLCDTYSPFIRRPSPWAALLDHYSYKHRLLFVVSAGNITTSFPVPDYADGDELRSANPEDRQIALMMAIEASKGTRGILSPAESMNSITVGAVHKEEVDPPVGGVAIDPYPDARLGMPNLASALGLGINRCIKPDVVESGGRFSAGFANVPGGGVTVSARRAPNMGQLVATPSRTGDLTDRARIAGTSNAAALVTRGCMAIADGVEQFFAAEGKNWLNQDTRACVLRALLTHSCSWGLTGEVLESIYPPQGSNQWSARRETISRFLGYGKPDLTRVIGGASNRITLLADDKIRHDKLNEYLIPIPPSMLKNRDLRTIVITLAYMAPVKPELADYRGVSLRVVSDGGKRDFWKNGVSRVWQPNSKSTDRGTVCHFILQGETLQKSANASGQIRIGVQAMARHSSFKNTDVPYALAVTLEVAQSVESKLYAEVNESVSSRQKSQTRTRQRV